MDARAAAVIRIDAVWLAVEPLDMRAGTETALARVVNVFGEARPHHAYLFANRRANRMKVLVHDGIGVWLAARRLNAGKFVWPLEGASTHSLTRVQLDALVLGLPWQRLGEAAIRPFCVGRRNWLFADTVAGANASANLYSLLQTCRVNGIDGYRYLRALFIALPMAQTADDYAALLPWRIDLTAA